ncbi:MAG: 50S ribosomal protein L19 [candidate division Zixibacteria bacterium]|nr:50S ribosomal protein L19 [candidate division Zixibacteria bacterium]NIT53719.1 50S ribosomal protein L19 [candidate division Zixibacteria bacterium]NIW42102.1 50S ribosomal protein L19 [candidate division Zixibacteria bacterium]NIX58002.1 50S ribosomal protein L19 [candidate division Zixibacteria bacterium]
MDLMSKLEGEYIKKDVPKFSAGDTVKVHVRIKEGDKERIQVFQGTVIKKRGSGLGASFTVRKVSSGVAVERVFPIHSPNVTLIERLRMGKVRRAKLYYLRNLSGKQSRIVEKKEDKKATNKKANEK